MDTRLRSIAKAVVWRIVSIIVLVIIAYMITGDLKETSVITILFQVILAVLYYLHERIWGRISWGKTRHPFEDIPVKRELDPEDKKIIEDKLRELGYIAGQGDK